MEIEERDWALLDVRRGTWIVCHGGSGGMAEARRMAALKGDRGLIKTRVTPIQICQEWCKMTHIWIHPRDIMEDLYSRNTIFTIHQFNIYNVQSLGQQYQQRQITSRR